MKYTIWLFDRTYEVVDEKDYTEGIEEVELAMIEKTPIRLGDTLVSGSAIAKVEPFGNKEYGVSTSDFISSGENSVKLPYVPTDLEKAKQEVWETLKKAGATDSKKRDYLATMRLAKKLHDTTNWKLKEWEDFAQVHQNPIEELSEIESRIISAKLKS